MPDLSDWNRLDTAAFRVSVKRSVHHLGWCGAIIAAIVVICGVRAPLAPLVGLGALLLCAFGWNAARPSVHGLLVDGVTVILTGISMCLAWVFVEHARPSAIAKWILVGLLQIAWGVRRLAFYRTARRSVNDP